MQTSARAVSSLPFRRRRDISPGLSWGISVNEWTEEQRSQSLKFTLGDYCYWQFHFAASVADPPLSVLVERPSEAAALGCSDRIRVVRTYPAPAPPPRLRFEERWLSYVPAQYRRHYIAFKPTFQEYLAKFSSKSRSTLQRKVRKLAQGDGKPDIRCYRTSGEMAVFYDLAHTLSQRTYQEKMFHEGFASRAGTKEHVVARASQGAVRGYALFLGDEPVAYVHCSCNAGTITYAILGYDQQHRALSPGDVLLYLMIEALHEERAFRYLDFGEGGAWYKEFYATDALDCARIYFFPKTMRNIVAVLLHVAAGSVSDAAGAVLDRLELRERIRRLFRRRAVGEVS